MKKLSALFALGGFASALAASVYQNHVGYDGASPKSLVVASSNSLAGTAWEIFPEGSLSPSLSGTFSEGILPADWTSISGSFYRLDFSEISTAGTYTLRFTDGGTEVEQAFTVSESLLQTATLGPVLNYFRNDRNTNSDLSVKIYGSSLTKDVHGGWNDASGDVSKYLSHLSYANYLNPQQIPFTVWALIFAAEHIPLGIEAATADKNFAFDEAVYGADFLLRMLDDAGFFYMTVFDNWGSGPRYLCAFSGSDGVKSSDYKAAFREGGGMAIAALAKASTLGASGDFSSAEYLAGAEAGFSHLLAEQTLGGECSYCDDGQENIIDDYTALLAASELFAATEKEAYLNIARLRAEHLAARISADGYFYSDEARTRPFWHASDAGLPLISLIRYMEIEPETTNEYYKGALAAAKKHLSWLISVTDLSGNPFGYAKQTYLTGGALRTGFFIPHDNESNYWWQGENARIASLSAAASYAARRLGAADSSEAFTYAADQLDWILGKNPYSVSFMHGIGKNNPPAYAGTLGMGMLKGGIANGITGVNTDGSGIVWNNVSAAGFTQSWQNWRWIEQWLPHSTWYLMALAARYDEVPAVLPSGVNPSKPRTKFSVALLGKTLSVTANRPIGTLNVLDLNGRSVRHETFRSNSATLSLANEKPGVYLLKISGAEARKIVLR